MQVHGDSPDTPAGLGWKPDPVPEREQNATDRQALPGFIRWAFKEHKAGDYAMLVLWGHAYRLQSGIRRRAPESTRSVRGLGEVLRPPGRNAASSGHGDAETRHRWLRRMRYRHGRDGCSTGAVCEVPAGVSDRHSAPGLAYDKVLNRLVVPEGRDVMDAAETGSYIVRRCCEAYTRSGARCR